MHLDQSFLSQIARHIERVAIVEMVTCFTDTKLINLNISRHCPLAD
jgi:hypothetical protein